MRLKNLIKKFKYYKIWCKLTINRRKNECYLHYTIFILKNQILLESI